MAVRFIRVVAALITDERGRYLVCQRHRRRPMPLKWEFPGGKIEAGETAPKALARELREELGIEAVVAQPAPEPVKRVQVVLPALHVDGVQERLQEPQLGWNVACHGIPPA